MTRVDRELREMRRAVALGKVNAFHDQAEILAEIVQRGVVDHGIAVDALWDTALANNLIDAHGVDFVQFLMSDAFGQPQPLPTWLLRAA
ncbi:hypothetical protein H8A95_05165 [Bradyrhizobium sp. Pear76]|uniref:hypothetical protein n=1 Tax=Bradyrhizobium oropedii TaxID=1571201 RepID=UPI001E309F11|nr:hypothetical protein [Bradyrhizobium oropedii]MCC8961725.1 hypothetical protein [Bradyrhizobium oropedii]